MKLYAGVSGWGKKETRRRTYLLLVRLKAGSIGTDQLLVKLVHDSCGTKLVKLGNKATGGTTGHRVFPVVGNRLVEPRLKYQLGVFADGKGDVVS